jgi:hypothetical protein
LNTSIALEMLNIIRAEHKRRSAKLPEDQEAAFEQWIFVDLPFTNELCLTLLLAMRHQIERELLRVAARVGNGTTLLTRQEYRDNIESRREQARTRRGREALDRQLQLQSCQGWPLMEALRLLANSYKHNPSLQPDQKLLRYLNLDPSRNYMPLPESSAFQEGLAGFIGLGKDADYCDIVEQFLAVSGRFIADVATKNTLSRVSGRVSLIHDVGC